MVSSVKLARTIAVMLLSCMALAGVAIYDLHSLGDKPDWNKFEQIRVKGYLIAGSVAGLIIPPIGPLNFISFFAKPGYYFATKTLPDNSEIGTYRELFVTDQFCKKLATFDAALKDSGQQWATKAIIHRVYFGSGSLSLFDDWAVLLAGSSDGKETQLSYFVWGMGIVPDERAPEFFGPQLGKLSILFPLKWVNRLEEYGLAKGYWVLLTESDQTSGFSYAARKLHGSQRRRQFIAKTKQIHSNKKGESFNDICGESLR